MALATRCPACTTVFRISTAQAAAKGGMVRCGQCRHVFNSLDALVRVEDLEVVDEGVVDPAFAPVADPPARSSPLDPRSRPVAIDEAIDEDVDEAGPGPVPTPTSAEATDGVTAEATGLPATPAASAWWLPEKEAADAPSDPPATPAAGVDTGAGTAADVGSADAEADASPPSVSGPSTPLVVQSPEPGPMDPGRDERRSALLDPSDARAAPSRRSRWLFGVLSLAAFVLLLGQAAHLWRDELAARWPPARPWLTMACERLGCQVEAPAHLAAITIESASVQALPSNPNLYVLSALLRNRDGIPVRYPNLQLVLTDLQDRPILRRALRPEDYLPVERSGRADTGFAADSEQPVRVTFELTDLRFAGYRLDRFYP